MNDYEACADLCDDRGFARQATLLRAFASGELRAFAVCERVAHEGGFLDDLGGVPVALFLDREDAERDALRRQVLAFRRRDLYDYCEREISYITITHRTREDFERDVSAILGVEYRLPAPETHKGPLFPADATDQAILEISGLINVQFYYVAALEFVDRANPLALGEPPP